MTPYENLLYEDSRKKSIIEHAQILYGAAYPKNHIWSVTISLKAFWYTAHVNVNDEPGSIEKWTVVKSGKRDESVLKALEGLLEELYVEVANSMATK